MTMQPVPFNYSGKRVAVTLPPRGARPLTKAPAPRRTRALPTVPPPTAYVHTVASPQSAPHIRPLPCPRSSAPFPLLPASSTASSTASSLASSSASSPASSSSSTSTSLSSTLSTRSPLTPPSPTLLLEDDDSLFDIGPIEFVRPNCDHFDSDCMSDSEDDEGADIIDPYQQIKKNKSMNHRWRTNWRLPVQDPTKKWVKETKGQRMTLDDFCNVRDILRTL